MRIFVALTPPEDLKNATANIIENLKVKYPGVVWENPQKIHLTVLFMGSASREKVNQIREILKELVTQTLPFELKIEGLSYLYNRSKDSIIMLDVKDMAGKMSELYKKFYKMLIAKNFSPPRRINLHITLGRLKRARFPYVVKQTLARILKEEINTRSSFTASSLEFYESLYAHDENTSQYRLIESFPFPQTY